MANDVSKTVVIDLKVTGDVGTALDNLKAKFTELSTAASGISSILSPIAESLSRISIPDNVTAGINALKSLDGLKLPDMTGFSEGLSKLGSVSGTSNDLTSLVNTLKSFEGIKVPEGVLSFSKALEKLVTLDKSTTDLSKLKTELEGFKDISVPGLQQFAKGLEALALARDKVGDAASTIRGLHGSVLLFKDLKLPELNNIAEGIKKLYEVSTKTGGDTKGITDLITAVSGLNGLKIPDMSRLSAGMEKLKEFSDPDGKIKSNLDSLKGSLTGLGDIKLPGLASFVSGLKALIELDVSKATAKITELSKGIELLEKSGTLKSFSNLASDLRSLSANLQSNVNPLNQIRTAFDNVANSATVTGNRVKSFGSKFVEYLQYRIVADSVMALESAFGKGIDVIRDYDQALKDLQAITGATDTEVIMMGKTIIDVAENTKFSATQVAEGMKVLGQAGFSATESIQTIRAVSDLATGTLSTLKETVDLVTTAMRVFDISSASSSHVADVFATAVNKSKLNIEMLRTAFNYVGPVAKDAGVSFEESAASLMVLANSGLRASTMGTGIRLLFSELADPPKKLSDAVEKAGMTMDQFDPKTQGLSKVLSNLNLVITDAGMAFDIFGKRGAAAVLTLKDSGQFTQMLSSLSGSGSAAAMAATQMEGLGVMIKNLKDKVELLAVSLGKAGVTEAFRLLVDISRNLVDALDAVINSGLGGFIVKSGLLIATTLTAVGIIGKLAEVFYAVRAVMVSNVVAGASVIATQELISKSSLAMGSFFRNTTVAIADATKAMWAFVASSASVGVLFGIVVAGVTAVSVDLYLAIERANKFKKAMTEAIEKAAKFSTLIAGIDEYSKKIKGLSEDSEELKNTNMGLRAELFKAADSNYEVAKAATAAALSIDPLTGIIQKGSTAIADYNKNLEQLNFDNLIKAANAAADEIQRPLEVYEKVRNKAKEYWATMRSASSIPTAITSSDIGKEGDEASKVKLREAEVFQNSAKKMEEAAKMKEALSQGKVNWKDYETYVNKVISEGAERMSSAEKSLVKNFQNSSQAGIAALDAIRVKSGLLLASSDEAFSAEAKKSKMQENTIEAMLYQLQKARDSFNKAEDNSAINQLIKDYAGASKGISEFKDTYLQMRRDMGKTEFSKEELEGVVGLDETRKALADRLKLLKDNQKARLALAGDDKVAQLAANSLSKQEDIKANEDIKKLYIDQAASFAFMSIGKVQTLIANKNKQIETIISSGKVEEAESLRIKGIELETQLQIQKAMNETFDPMKFKRLREEYKRAQDLTIADIKKQTAEDKLNAVELGKSPAEAIASGKSKETYALTEEAKQEFKTLGELRTKYNAMMQNGEMENSKVMLELSKEIADQELRVSHASTKRTEEKIEGIVAEQKVRLEGIQLSETEIQQKREAEIYDERTSSARKIEILEEQKLRASAIENDRERQAATSQIDTVIHDEKMKQIQSEVDALESKWKKDLENLNNAKARTENPATHSEIETLTKIALKDETALKTLRASASSEHHAAVTSQISQQKELRQLTLSEMQSQLKSRAEKHAEALGELKDNSEITLGKIDDEKISAQMSFNELERSSKLRSLNREAHTEKVNAKREELRLVQEEADYAESLQSDGSIASDNAIFAAKKKALTDLMNVKKSSYALDRQLKQEELADNRDVAQKELAEATYLWKHKEGSAERYHAALKEMQRLGVTDERKTKELMIESSDDQWEAMKLGARRAFASIEHDSKFMADLAQKMIDAFAGGMADAFTSFINGTKTASAAFRDFATGFLNMVVQMIAKQMILNALQYMGVGVVAADGGEIGKITATKSAAQYASGGSIWGSSPNDKADNIPIWATAGEFMHPVSAVKKYGISFMESIRTLQFPSDLSNALSNVNLSISPSSNRLANGGTVPSNPQPDIRGGDTKLQVVNILDRNLVGDFVSSGEGATVLLNFIRKHGTEVRAIVGG